MRFDLYTARFACKPVAITAPCPVFGVLYKPFGNGISMDVAELFDKFGLGDDVAVIVSGAARSEVAGHEEMVQEIVPHSCAAKLRMNGPPVLSGHPGVS